LLAAASHLHDKSEGAGAAATCDSKILKVGYTAAATHLSASANMRRFMAQGAAEVAQRRAIFDAAVATPTP
jgi:hypothetical protein